MNSNTAAGPDLLVIGGANLDIVASSHAALVLADSNPGALRCAAGGVARNVAHNLARLGYVPALVSVLGRDPFGQTVLETTRAAGVDMRWCWQLDDARTATYLSLHGQDGDMALAINDMDILRRLDATRLAPLAPALRAARCVVLDCNLHADALAWVFAHAAPGTVVVDAVSAIKCVRLRPWLAQVHTLKVNRLEAAALTGLRVDSVAEAQAAAQALCQAGVAQVVVSLGAQGALWCSADGDGAHLPAGPVQVVNTSGAGDALVAGLVHARLQGWPTAQALRWAMACAELTLESPVAHAPTLSVAAVQARLACAAAPTPASVAP